MVTLKEWNEAHSTDRMAANLRSVYFVRMVTSIAGGTCAGTIGLTGILGFLFFFFSMALVVASVIVKSKEKGWRTYFNGWEAMATDNLSDCLLTYVLFWTLFYGVVHLY
jgi:hypothetical protein